MFFKIYYWLRRQIISKEERGELSSGILSKRIRETVLSSLKEKEGMLLDIGCGEGLFILPLLQREKRLKVFGLEIWNLMIERLKRRTKGFNLRIVKADAKRLPFKEESFHFITCLNFIYNFNINDIYVLMGEVYRVLKKGGIFIFEFRNKKNFFVFTRYLLAPLYDPTFIKDRVLTPMLKKTVYRILNFFGFNLVEEIKVGFFKVLPDAYIFVVKK